MKLSTLMLAALLLWIFIGCNEVRNNDIPPAVIDQKQEEKSYSTDTAGLPGAENEVQQDRQQLQSNTTNQDWEKKIIKTATLNLEVESYRKYYKVLYESVRRIGGYVAQESQSQSEYKIENSVSIKVPVVQFDDAVSLLVNGTGHEKLIAKEVASEDATGQIVDTKSRLEAKRQVRQRYLELLKQAKNMGEVLQVQNEINELQEQIEMAAGRMSYLNQSAAYSTIHLTFFQVLDPSAGIHTEPSFVIKLVTAFRVGWDFIKQLILGMISIWPLLILLVVIWFGLKKRKLSKIKA